MTRFSNRSARGSAGVSVVIAIGALFACASVALWLLARTSTIGLDLSVEGAVALIRSWGTWGVAGSIALMVAHSFLPFPAEIIACANGLIYGPMEGAAITWAGAMLGASAAFGVARCFGRPFAHWMLKPDSRRQLAAWSGRYGARALLVSRLIPVIAFNLINYAAALTNISWWTFLWATGIGILPLTIMLAVLGDRMLTIPVWVWLLVGVAAVVFWLFLERRRPALPRQ